MPISIIPFVLLIIPIVEIGVFIAIGDRIGMFYTLMLIFVTAIIGSILLRLEGFRVLGQIQKEINAGRIPARELISGVMILVAGVLLLTPGFVTDSIGFLLFLPPVRSAIQVFLTSRIKAGTFGSRQGGFDEYSTRQPPGASRPDGEGPVVDLDESAWTNEGDPSSPWRNSGNDGNSDKRKSGGK